jgi:diguanylate cyclase (GGDEF)-like protein/PAS domain S-box-containing protein
MRFVYVNGVLARATGLTAEHLIGRAVAEMEAMPAPDGWIATLGKVLDTGEAGSIVYAFETPDGPRWFESRLEPEPDPEGVVAHVLVLTRDVTEAHIAQERLRANEREQDALRTVATAVAAEGSAPELYALVAEEAGRLLDMEMAGVSRFVPVGPALVEGAWSAPGAVGDGAVDESWGDAITLTGEATIFGTPGGPGEGDRVIGVAAPIRVGQRLWGAVAAATTRPGAIDPAATDILSRFAELVSLAISSAEAREQLLALASTDPLTGLPNLRTFTQRLGDEVVRARRHARPLSLMMIDVDHFKLVNDTHGHEAGNLVLIEVARRLAGLSRGEDTVARVGGEEFAWILPEASARGAYWVAERARAAIGEMPFVGVGHLTISAGVCEIDEATHPDELFRRADAALYSAKAQGRNTTVRWSPGDDVIPIRSSPEASTSGQGPPG